MLSKNEIFNEDYIGKHENPIQINDLLAKAEPIESAIKDTSTTLLLGIDLQYDFLEDGALGVPGSHEDMRRLLNWTYDNLAKITSIKLSEDTHNVYQVFHSSWWKHSDGNSPPPYTPITLEDLDNRVWIPVINPIGTRDYVENLEKLGKKTLIIWPYHCIQGTQGAAIDNQFMNLALYHSVIRKSRLSVLVKGTDPMSEMYGIFKPEYDPKNIINIKMLDMIAQYDRIVITGQAKSHCVLESINQMLDHYQGESSILNKIFI
ncbi:hypothetical protein LCGC14_1266290, partial [marine sediment metagenome]